MNKFRLDDCRLRPVGPDDAARILAWRNSDRVRFNMYTTGIISEADHKAWFERMLSDESCRYMIFEYRGRPVGLVNVTHIDRRNSKAYWGFYLGETDVPKGMGPVMEVVALDYVFAELKIRKLSCEVLDFNERVVALHKRFGFEEQARYVAHILREDGPHDVIGLYLMAERWHELRPAMAARLFET